MCTMLINGRPKTFKLDIIPRQIIIFICLEMMSKVIDLDIKISLMDRQ